MHSVQAILSAGTLQHTLLYVAQVERKGGEVRFKAPSRSLNFGTLPPGGGGEVCMASGQNLWASKQALLTENHIFNLTFF